VDQLQETMESGARPEQVTFAREREALRGSNSRSPYPYVVRARDRL